MGHGSPWLWASFFIMFGHAFIGIIIYKDF